MRYKTKALQELQEASDRGIVVVNPITMGVR